MLHNINNCLRLNHAKDTACKEYKFNSSILKYSGGYSSRVAYDSCNIFGFTAVPFKIEGAGELRYDY